MPDATPCPALARLLADIDAAAQAAREQVRQSFEAARARLGFRRVLLDTERTYRLPARFACPECGARLLLEVGEWGSCDGIPSLDGTYVHCEAEEGELWAAASDNRDPEWAHRLWQSDWMPVVQRVHRWAVRNVRVRVAC